MPIFRDDFDHATTTSRAGAGAAPAPARSSSRSSCLRGLSGESTVTEFCEGPIIDEPLRSGTPENHEDVKTSDRTELIKMIKRGASPTWIPNKHLESMMQHAHHPNTKDTSQKLLPSVQIAPGKGDSRETPSEQLHHGMSIERPRSALHSGDFTTDSSDSQTSRNEPSCQARHAPHAAPHDWFPTSPPRHLLPFAFDGQLYPSESPETVTPKPFPLSSSFSSSLYQPPTSPLVQSETNDELAPSLSTENPAFGVNRQVSARRHTLYSSHPSPSTSYHSPFSIVPSRISRRREGALPSQAHQPRRSLSGTPDSFVHHGVPPSTPAIMRPRRLSVGSNPSPLHHASMVVSYEESILRGRMSTTPSRPIEFLAQIGVLGKGSTCPPMLECPRHVTLPFLAVYYNYDDASPASRGTRDDISPYVGQIDLENGLLSLKGSKSRRRALARMAADPYAGTDAAGADVESYVEALNMVALWRGGSSSKAPLGGSYRIPQKGQIQIIVKNQNKTAVKLFLVPYDLADMTPGTKTFIRQRIYSDPPPSSVDPLTGDGLSTPSPAKRILRYLIHLHICCTTHDYYYLYNHIRIVFASRVPDAQEKLRSETTWPEPRFSPYKAVPHMSQPVFSFPYDEPCALLIAERAIRRRSLGLLNPSFPTDEMGMEPPPPPEATHQGYGPASPHLRNVDGLDDVPEIPPPSGATVSQEGPGTPDPWSPTQYEKMDGFVMRSGSASGSDTLEDTSTNIGEGLLSQRVQGLRVNEPPASPPNQ